MILETKLCILTRRGISPILLLTGYMTYEYLKMKGLLGKQKIYSTSLEAMPFEDDSLLVKGQERNNQDRCFEEGDKSETTS